MNDEYDRSSDSEQEEEAPRRRRRTSSSPSQPVSKRARSSPPAETNGQTRTSSAMTPLSLSILGVEPLDEFIREIADWVHGMILSRPDLDGQVEVEAKLGLLKYKDGGQRLNHPVRVETILLGDDHKFESNMTAAQHKHFNTLLNKLEASSRQPSHPTSPLRYTHSYLVDSFYASDDHHDRGKVRVTRDEKTGEVRECMKKVRLGDMEIFSPKRCVDWRVSVNIEVPVSQPLGTAVLTRRKDRVSYSHEEFSIDLTQVTQSAGPGNKQIMHELELEFAHPVVLMSAAAVRGDANASAHERDAFDELIRAFVNNVRVLVRNAIPS